MSLQKEVTTLVCLFHHKSSADAAANDLAGSGIARESLQLIGGPDAAPDALEKSELASLGMPDKDYDHLKQGIRDGGVVVAVSNVAEPSIVESIFHKHSAEKIDETDTVTRSAAPLAAAPLAAAAASTTGQTAIPIIEEELVVGKRTVAAGGVQVYRRIVEVPVEKSVELSEEHVTIDRRPVNRPVSDADLAFGDRTIELVETREEAVVGKTARVVEEITLEKTATERVETVSDTVRHTEIDVEEVPGEVRSTTSTQR